ncbi:MAG: M48 family metallopeptidase [Pseudomonadota bacterium]
MLPILLPILLSAIAGNEAVLQQRLDRLSAGVVAGHARAGRIADTPPAVEAALAEVRRLFPDTDLRVVMLAQPEANATALPGGQILINEGLLLQVHSFAELKFLLAHEAAHVAERHVARHVLVDSGMSRAELEIDADRVALDALAQEGSALRHVRLLMRRLESLDRGPPPERLKQLEERLPLPQRPVSVIPPILKPLHERAIHVLLHSGRVEPVAEYLAATEATWPPEKLARWHWALAQRRGIFADEVPNFINAWTQAQAPLLATDGADRCLAGSGTPYSGRVLSWQKLAIPRLDGWRRGLETGSRLVLTSNHARLHRLDLWPPGKTPADGEARRLPCATGPVALWHLLVDLSEAFPTQVFELESAWSLADGLLAVVAQTDESGVEWRLLAARRQLGGATVYGLYRAPAQHFFPSRRGDAERLFRGLAEQP